jgi:transposase
MPPFLYPPQDFECLYRHCCPYLDGLSTTWVLGQYRRADDVYQEHLRIIDVLDGRLKVRDERIRVLERENAELKAKLQALHRRQFKPNKKKDEERAGKDANRVSSSVEKKKKRGAPVGHPGWVRPKPDHIDRTVDVPAPRICPHCQSNHLTVIEEKTEHLQEDIVIRPRTLVTRYLHGQAFCAQCNRPVVQAGAGEMLNAPIGPVAKSVAIYLRYRIGISYRKTGELFRELLGLDFVPASALGFDRKAAVRGEPIYEDLRDKIRASDVVHGDETSWRSDGLGHYVWFAGNKDLAFFHIDRHRSADVAKSIFGESFAGTLVRDRYAAYNGIGVDWQSCIAHIITKAKEISAEHELLPPAEKDANVGSFCEGLIDLGSRLCDVGKKLE